MQNILGVFGSKRGLILEINSKCSVSVSHCKSATIAHALALVYSEIALEFNLQKEGYWSSSLFILSMYPRTQPNLHQKKQAISPLLLISLRRALQDSELKGWYNRSRRNSRLGVALPESQFTTT
jgi:hypothetical protein